MMNSKGKRKKRPWRSLRQLETCLEGLGKTKKPLRITSVMIKMRKRALPEYSIAD
jgi:hypothetical protein